MVASMVAVILGSTEGAIKLLISILLGYLLAFIHRTPALYKAHPNVKHVLYTLEGMALCYYNFGMDSIHVWINVTIIYFVLSLFGGNKFTAVFSFVFNTGYLVTGYYLQMKFHEFGISWTMPMCVLTLRLTGVAFDFYDGQKKLKDDGKPESDVALAKQPTYLEMLGHSYFFGGVLVGPQFPMKRYLAFVNGEYAKDSLAPNDSIRPGLHRLLQGLAYIVIFQLLALLLPDAFMMSEDFRSLGLFTKCALIMVWGKNALHKYCGIWLMQEGAIIVTGMSYNGVDKNDQSLWDACTNIKVWQLETGETFSDFIKSFNFNTNQWMLKYVHRRLRFLGSKMLSQALTLFYLALWHGLQSGYYMCFFLELVMTKAEMETKWLLKSLVSAGVLPGSETWGWPMALAGRVIRKMALTFLWSYAMVTFVLLDGDKWIPIHATVFYVGHVLCFLVIIVATVCRTASANSHKANGVHTTKKVECE